MKREFFNMQFAALLAAYTISGKIPDETQDVYWEMLKDMPEDKFQAGVRECLANYKFFPTISELGAASLPSKIKTMRTSQRFVSYNQDWKGQLEDMRRGEDKLPSKVTKLLQEF